MPLPEGLTYVTVTGSLADISGGDARVIVFRTPSWLLGSSIVRPFGLAATVAADGTFAIELPATDDPAWSPVNWAYDVLIGVGSSSLYGTLTVPIATVGSLDLVTAMTTDAPSDAGQVSYLLLSMRSAPGGVAGLDADGDVINAAGSKITGGGGGGGSTAWTDITGKPATFTPSAHAATHGSAGSDPISINGSQITAGTVATARLSTGTGSTNVAPGDHTHTAAAIGADSAGTATSAVATHVAASDPHTQYALETDVATALAAKSGTEHTHAGSDITSGTVPIARIPTGQTGTTVPFGNDARFTDARTPTAHAASHGTGQSDAITVAQGQVTGLSSSLAALAPLASPTLTGTPSAPTATAGTSTTQIATTAFAGAAATAAVTGVARDVLSSGETVLNRDQQFSEVGLATGSLILSYFTATKTETINNVITALLGTVGASNTLARIGIYSVGAGGALTALLASTPNDTALWTTGNANRTKALSAPWAKVAGVRYAIGALCVGGTQPSLIGIFPSSTISGLDPRSCGIVTGQTDLPASVVAGSVANDFRKIQFIVTP